MTKKDSKSAAGGAADRAAHGVSQSVQRPSAESLYAEELEWLREDDAGRPRPEGWKLMESWKQKKPTYSMQKRMADMELSWFL